VRQHRSNFEVDSFPSEIFSNQSQEFAASSEIAHNHTVSNLSLSGRPSNRQVAMENNSISDLTDGSSLVDQTAHFQEVFGMDETTALLLYRADRLHEKGKMKLAQKFYQKVFQVCPACTYASACAEVVTEHLKEEASNQQSLVSIPEKPAVINSHRPMITEMDVQWTGRESIQFDSTPDPDACAFAQAKTDLRSKGYGASLLVLLKNEVLEDICDANTGWETVLSGRARFRVTLIPDKEDPLDAQLSEAFFRSMMLKKKAKSAPKKINPAGGEAPATSPVAPVAAPLVDKTAQVAKDSGSDLSSSRFADAESG